MPQRPDSFTKTELKRALKSLREIGVPVKGVEFAPNGKFTALVGEPEPAAANGDADLDRELAEFEARHGQV